MPVDIEKLEAVIESACREAVRGGWRLKPGMTINTQERCCCPMGAVLLASGEQDGLLIHAAMKVGMARSECADFAYGFDGRGPSWNAPDLFALGAKFRRRVDAGEFTRAVVCPEMP